MTSRHWSLGIFQFSDFLSMLSGFFVVVSWFLLSSLFLGEHSGGVLPVRLTPGGS